MIIILIMIFALCLYKVNVKRTVFFEDFLDRESTNSIKGVFILFVFLRHSLGYIIDSGRSFDFFDKIVGYIDGILGQFIVVMFLFYSGYGVMESIKKKGNAYITSMPRKRILTTLLNFDIAVLCFVVLNLLLDISMNPMQLVLSLTGWDSIGNSNWYIFVILVCYIATYFAYKMRWGGAVIALSVIVGIFLYICGKGPWWYNTILSYAAGMIFSTKKQIVIDFWKKNYWKSFVILCFLFVMLYITPQDPYSIKYNFLSIAFALIVVLLSMKVKISNPILCWLGLQLFPLYIYQRIPMRFFYYSNPNFVSEYPVIFMGVSLAITIFIAFFYRYWQIGK